MHTDDTRSPPMHVSSNSRIAQSRNAILQYGMPAGIILRMPTMRKVTVVLPEALLEKAQESTQEGITPTIRRGLELVAAERVYEQLRKWRGRYRPAVALKVLREDRS